MGKAVEIKEALRRGRDREWVLDAAKGTLAPKPDPEAKEAQDERSPASEAIYIAPQTWD